MVQVRRHGKLKILIKQSNLKMGILLMTPGRRVLFLIMLACCILIGASAATLTGVRISRAETAGVSSIIHHDLKVILYPGSHRFTAEDTVTLPERPDRQPGREMIFALHQGLAPVLKTPGVPMSANSEESPKGMLPSLQTYKVSLPAPVHAFTITYGGVIYQPVSTPGEEQAHGFADTSGLISEDGVYLSPDSFWYPHFNDEMVTFTLNVSLPSGWDAVSQGARSSHARGKSETTVQWESPELQEGIFLIGGKFSEYELHAGHFTAMAFLRTPDNELANKYMDAAVRYITMYEKLIGPYPYKKFALVENFWETGFGMPSFTLLGPKIIRFPFIITSSYPHEILHNWWGNSVFPDIARGNWSEGLTAYLSDYLMNEQQGGGSEFRRETLQKYTDYVRGNRDFPVAEFHSRHSPSSEAIGYGKSLMFFHMLRRELGDKIFTAGLQSFYNEYKLRLASFDDLRKTFEKVSVRDLKEIFDEWTLRTGGPKLKLRDVAVTSEKDGYLLTGLIEQVQSGKPYRLLIPLAVTLEGKKEAYQTSVVMDKRVAELSLHVPARPLRLDVDPEFDLFRRLDRDEIPPALSQALGSKKMLVLLPSSAGSAMLQAYREFARLFAGAGPESVEIKTDAGVSSLPSDRAVVLLGWENRFLGKATASLSGDGVAFSGDLVQIGKDSVRRENNSIVLTAKNPASDETSLTFIATAVPEGLPGLARKLPHYGKYSYLCFEGNEPTNILKGRWPVTYSTMTVFMRGKDNTVRKVEMAELAPRKALIKDRNGESENRGNSGLLQLHRFPGSPTLSLSPIHRFCTIRRLP